ncbi:MAG: sigma-70 family RNA polymerase sigma factor [Planctomycetes bacterium]|nr:sigma-70 family RNA polymerase sigma factor [Planctomycetota bacterium]
MQDDELLRRFVMFRDHGDAAALAAVFDALAGDLFRLALHWTRRTADAEDAVAETFLAAMTHAGRFDASRPLQPWLVGILAHQSRRIRDASVRARTPLDRCDPEPSRHPIDDASDREWATLTRDAVLRMAPRDRLVLEPILFRGASIGDVARALDAKAGTVRVRLHRALERLRRLLRGGTAAFAFAPNLFHVRTIVWREGVARGVLSPAAASAWSAGIATTGATGAWFAMHGSKVALAATLVVAIGALRLWTRGDPLADPVRVRATASEPLAAVHHNAWPEADRTDDSTVTIPERVAQESPPSAPQHEFATVRVVDRESHAPVAGAEVVLDDGNALERWITDDDGGCSIERAELAPSAVVCARAGGFADEVRRIDDELPATIDLTRSCRITGVVTRRDGTLEPFAHVELWVDSRHTCEPPRVVADARGVFTLEGVDPRRTPTARARSADGMRTGLAVVVAEAIAGQPLTIVVDRGADVAVRVVDAERGTPIPGAMVVCGIHELVDPPPPRKVALDALPYGAARTTAQDGVARFEQVPLHGIHVVAAANGYALGSTFLVQRQPDGVVDVELALVAESAVAGIVVDADDVPVRGASIDVAWNPIDIRSTAVLPFLRGHATMPEILRFTTTTDAQGHFRIGCLEAARFVRVIARDVTTDVGGHVDTPLAAGAVRDDLVVRLERRATITVRAFDVRGDPIRSARVGRQRANEHGTIHVATVSRPRRGFVVDAPGHVKRRIARDVEVRDGMTFDVTLESAITLRGRIVDDTAAAAPDVVLDASWTDGEGDDAATEFVQSGSRRDGTFELAGLPARRVHVALRSPAHSDLELDVDVSSAAKSDVVWTMRRRGAGSPPASVEGTIVDRTTGALRTDAKAILVRVGQLPALDAVGETYSTEAGRFAFRDVAPGTVRVLAFADGAASELSPPLTLAPGAQIEDIVVALAPGVAWSGFVVDAAQSPCVGLALRATRIVEREDEPALVRVARSGSRGEVTFAHLVPGRYRVTLEQRDPTDGARWTLRAEQAGSGDTSPPIPLGGNADGILVVAVAPP